MDKGLEGDFSCFISKSHQLKKDLINLHTRFEMLAKINGVSITDSENHPIIKGQRHVMKMGENVDSAEDQIQDFFRLIRSGTMTQRQLFTLNSNVSRLIKNIREDAKRIKGLLVAVDEDYEFYLKHKDIKIIAMAETREEGRLR